MTPEQLEYVKGELAKGFTPDEVKQTLRINGYTEELIAQLFGAVESGIPPAAVPQQVVIQKEGPSILKIVLIVVGVLLGLFVLISVVLGVIVSASLNSARDKGMDASTKATMNSSRAMAELYYDDNRSSYAGFCSEFDTPREANHGKTKIECEDSATEYRMYAELITGGYFCVDSTGRSELIDMPVRQPDSLTCK